MAVDRHLKSILNCWIKNVHYFHHMLKCCRCHIFPALIKPFDTMRIKILRNITESDLRNNSITAKRMLNINFFNTYPGYWRFNIVPILDCLKTLYKLNCFMRRSEGLCIANIFSVIQFECSPYIAFGCILFCK